MRLASRIRHHLHLKAEYPGFNPNEIANACYIRFGRRPARKTVKRVLVAEEPFPLRMMRRFPSYHEIPEPGERRRAVVALHAEGWLAPLASAKAIAVETSVAVPQPRLFGLDALGETGWLKALKLEGYARRRPQGPQALQQALFPYAEAL